MSIIKIEEVYLYTSIATDNIEDNIRAKTFMDNSERHWSKEFRSMLHSANNPWEEDICDEMQFLSHLKKSTVQKGPKSARGFLVAIRVFSLFDLFSF